MTDAVGGGAGGNAAATLTLEVNTAQALAAVSKLQVRLERIGATKPVNPVATNAAADTA